MNERTDRELIEHFVRDHSDEAFTRIVERHVGLVHSVALRYTANPEHAQDITQAVFILLARKAPAFGAKTVLAGWLYNTARLTAANFQRSESRRIRREQETFMQSATENASDSFWREMAPSLEEAMSQLGTTDRDAVVLRYFQNKTLPEVGVALGIESGAAQKRVSRALEKLRSFLSKRGVVSTSAVIAAAMSANSVHAAPLGLAGTVTATAAKGAAVSSSILTLVKGTTKIMAWAKMKTAIGLAVGMALMGGATAVIWASNEPGPEDLVSFFKQSLTTPSVIERFREKMTVFRIDVPGAPKVNLPATTFFEGARQGDDFISSVVDSDANGPLWNKRITVQLRERGKNYQFNSNTLSLGVPNTENPIDIAGLGAFAGINQCLNMGVSFLDPQKITWHGNEFTAVAPSGIEVVGTLSLSNGVPVKLALRTKGNDAPFTIISYAYPTPTTKLGGFPERIGIWSQKKNEIEPEVEIALLEVKIAPRRLPEDFFSPARVQTRDIRFTNYYSNNVLFVRNADGALVRAPEPAALAR